MTFKLYTAGGYEEFQSRIADIPSGRITALFTGSKLLSTGLSWCPDCVKAEPVVEKVINEKEVQALDVSYVIVFVGNKEEWKNPECVFRTDPKLKLTCIPTLLEYGKKGKKLIDDQVANANLVKELFTSED